MAALRVVRQAKNLQRTKAARTIQKHWKAALRDVSGPNGTKKVHRSRVVRHRGTRYDARNVELPLYPSNEQNVRWPNGTPMSPANMNTVRARRIVRLPNDAKRTRHRLQQQALAQKAFETSAHAFAPYRRAGWTPITVHYVGRNNVAQKTFVVPKRWSSKALREVFANIVSLSNTPQNRNTWYMDRMWPLNNWNNNSPHASSYKARWYRRRQK